jgi:two-component system phosphate regulon sensor histidine kinase PhoR
MVRHSIVYSGLDTETTIEDQVLLIDLRWLLFYMLLAVVIAVLLIAWWGQRRRTLAPGQEESWIALERAPFALLVLKGLQGPRGLPSAHTYHYANAQARHLLDLPSSHGPLPQAEWVSLLQQDRRETRQEVTSGRYGNVSLTSGPVVRWWITPWQDLDVVLMLDITAQRQAEEASGRLLSDLSHELRTPLATILTHLEVLLLDDVSPTIEQRSLHLLKAEARRMGRLINDMLELGRLEISAEIEQRPVDLLNIAERAAAQVAPQAQERGIALSLRADAPLPLVTGDRDRLHRVLLNLLDNAIKYSRSGDQVEVALRREGETLVCAIVDTGPGIPAEHLPHVTRRFYRAAPAQIEGSGLGLALVQEILRRHSSQLEIDSDADGQDTGTRVSFALSVLPESEAIT